MIFFLTDVPCTFNLSFSKKILDTFLTFFFFNLYFRILQD